MNNDRAVYESLLRLTERLKEGCEGVPEICKWVRLDVEMSPGCVQAVLSPHLKSWPKFSGSVHYPVPSGSEHMDAGEMYEKVCHTGEGLWDRTHPYGANRRELLTFLIHTLLKQIHDEENNQPTIGIK